MKITTAYIHIPFCKSKCFYCDFNSYAGKDDRISVYFNALNKEIGCVGSFYEKQKDSLTGPLESVYIGGGTPSYAPSGYVSKTIDTLRSVFGFADDIEITIECNPGTADLDKFLEYKRCGINRISIGLQSTSDILLKNLGRIHTVQEFEECVRNAGLAGFTNLNADLMSGLPGQKVSDITDSIKFLLKKNISHISLYSLILEEGTPFYERFGTCPELLPSEEIEREMYHTGVEELKNNGFLHYEISNLAKPGYFCKQNTRYWETYEYLGFGAGAHSYQQHTRHGNEPDIDSYIKRIDEFTGLSNAPCAVESNYLTLHDRELEYFLLGFRLLEGINGRQFKEYFGKGMVEYMPIFQKLADEGYIIWNNDNYRLSEKGIDYANQVFIEFV